MGDLLARVSGRVWDDEDGDGLQDEGEAAVAGWWVGLYATDGELFAKTDTDEAGYYLFTDVPEGLYTLGFAEPGTSPTFTLRDQGDDDLVDSDAAPDGSTYVFALSPGDFVIGIDAGLSQSGIYLASHWSGSGGPGKRSAHGARIDFAGTTNTIGFTKPTEVPPTLRGGRVPDDGFRAPTRSPSPLAGIAPRSTPGGERGAGDLRGIAA